MTWLIGALIVLWILSKILDGGSGPGRDPVTGRAQYYRHCPRCGTVETLFESATSCPRCKRPFDESRPIDSSVGPKNEPSRNNPAAVESAGNAKPPTNAPPATLVKFDISHQRSVQVPDMFGLAKGENPGLSQEAFIKHLVRTMESYYASKKARASATEPFKDVVFRNWVYTSLMINIVYDYLIEGSGDLLSFYRAHDISQAATAAAVSELKTGVYPKDAIPWGLHNPSAMQAAWNSYERDPWKAFFNLSFNVSFKDGYLLPLIASNFQGQFAPSTYTREEAHNLSGGLSAVFTEHFKIAFAHFEQSADIAT